MAFRAKRKFNRKKFNRKPRHNKSTASKALSMVKKLYRTRETKYATNISTTSGSSPANTWNSGINLLEVAQGDSASTRDGNQLYLKYLNLRADVRLSSDQTNIPRIRIVVVQDLQQRADTAPSTGDIFYNTGIFNSFYNYPTVMKRFKILYDRIMPVGQLLFSGGYYNGVLGTQWYDHTINGAGYFKIPLKRFYKTIYYNGTASTDIQRNGIYLFYAFDEANDNELSWYSQLAFTDS